MVTKYVCALAAVALASAANAQLTPDRMYYGVGRPIPMTVKVPSGKAGEVRIALLEPVTAKEFSTAAAAAGGVNLATLFPEIWGKQDSRVFYAQLVVGEEKVGPAVVIHPLADRGSGLIPNKLKGDVTFVPTGRAYSGIRAWVDKNIVIETTKGSMTFEMRPDQAPNTVVNFMHLVEGGFYTDISFHRILGAKDYQFMVQAGDPTGKGTGGPGYAIDLENSKLPHDFGVLSMARGSEPDTSGSQFFICLSRARCMFLDGKFTSFGQLVSGADTLVAIGETPCGMNTESTDKGEKAEKSKPLDPPRILKAHCVDAAPYGTGPKPATAPIAAPVNR